MHSSDSEHGSAAAVSEAGRLGGARSGKSPGLRAAKFRAGVGLCRQGEAFAEL